MQSISRYRDRLILIKPFHSLFAFMFRGVLSPIHSRLLLKAHKNRSHF